MSDPLREELSKAISELGERYPHWRFGQLVINVAGWADQDAWDVEDDQLLRVIREHLAQKSVPNVASVLQTPSPASQQSPSISQTP